MEQPGVVAFTVFSLFGAVCVGTFWLERGSRRWRAYYPSQRAAGWFFALESVGMLTIGIVGLLALLLD